MMPARQSNARRRSLSGPDASGRVRALPSPLPPAVALLLGALCLFPAAQAAAQDIVLVSNLGQQKHSTSRVAPNFFEAQAFTTGGNTGGYSLGSIDAAIEVTGTLTAADRQKLRVEVWSTVASGSNRGQPNAKRYDLTVPSSVETGNVSFDAPDNAVLDANTTYFAVFYVTASLSTGVAVDLTDTTSDDEDSGGQAGWSVADGRFLAFSGLWYPAVDAFRIRVNGSAVTDPPGRPVGLAVTPGATQLALAWTAPSGSPTSYEVHYTSSTSVADDAAAGTAVATQWVSVTGTVTGTSRTITGLTNNTAYRVRVRGVNAQGSGPWAFGTGTPKATTTGSTDASLSALVLTSAFREAVPFEEGTFSATTYAYTTAELSAAESNFMTVTPTVNDTLSTVKVNGTAVTSGSASGSILPGYGASTITIEVTAQAGNTRNYTITVNRAVPRLHWSSTTGRVAEGSRFVPRFARPQTNDMSGTVTYAPGATNPASLTDDLGSGRSTTFTMTSGDAYPSDISVPIEGDDLNEERETFTITINAGTGYTVGTTATMTVTINDDDPPAAPGSLSLSAGNTALAAEWQKPAGPVAQYQLRWKTSAAKDTVIASNTDPTMGWVEGGAVSSSSLTQTITSLSNGTAYNVQVRADDGQTGSGNGWGAWSASQTETPLAKSFGFSPATITVAPGVAADFGVTLTQAAPAGGLALTITRLLGTDVPTGACGSHALAAADDVGASPPTSVTVAGGATEATFSYPTADNGDDLVRRTECFALRLSTTTAGWTAATGEPGLGKVVIQRPSGRIAFGTNAAATAKLTRTVVENVTGDTVQVPVTVDWLPRESVTFAVEVVSTGTTATEGTDFSIGTKSVTFGTATAKTQHVTVTITNDNAVEEDETIELRLLDGPGTSSVNDAYTRHAQGRLAAVTIDSEDAVPGAVRDLSAAPDSAELDVSWKAPSSAGSSAVTAYEVHYTSAADTGSMAVADDAAASGSDASAAWVAAADTVTGLEYSIGSLVNDRPYRVRVRAANAVGSGPWAHAKGTPALGPKYGFARTDLSSTPGGRVDGDVTLSEAAPQGGLRLTVELLLGSSNLPAGLCTGTLADAADIASNPPTSVTVAAGATTARFRLRVADNGDDLVGGSECFALRLGTTAAGWTPARGVIKVSIAVSQGRIAFGSNAGSTAKYTATVAETVTGGTVDVPVTVDYLPAASTTVPVAVQGGSTATETADFSIATKSVTFGPQTDRTQNVEVTIVDDNAAEGNETIELRIAGDVVDDFYVRQAQSRLAAVTITSEDAVPGAPEGLEVSADSARLELEWRAPSSVGSSAVTGYEVHYTSSATVADDADAGTSVGTEWVASATVTGTTHAIGGLENDRAYRVRVRAANAVGSGPWTQGSGTPAATPKVTLEADPNPVAEGSGTTLTATLDRALASNVSIPLAVSDSTSETGDYAAPSSIALAAGATEGTATVRTRQDTDTDDEVFTVAVDEANLPEGVRAGNPSAVRVTITDDDKAEASLEVSPNPVGEGSDARVTVRLTKALPSAVTIPLALTSGTAEDGDYGELASISVPRGRRSASGTISTVRDTDSDDETFVVALDESNLPSSVLVGDPSSVEVTIEDEGVLRVGLSASRLRPNEGQTSTLTATLSHPAPAGGVEVWFTADGAGDNPAAPVADFTLAPAAAGQNATSRIAIAEGERTARGWLRVVNDDEPEDDEGIVVAVGVGWETDAARPELELTIPANDGGGGTGAAAWIEVEPNPVEEGDPVTVRVRLTRALDEAVTIPLTVRRGTSERGDHGTLDEIEIAAGEDGGEGVIETTRDEDADDETFTVRLGSPLPAGVRAGAASSVTVTIDDADEPDVWIEAEPNPVDEGDPVTVTAVLTAPLSRAVTIPVTVERGTSERGDHGTLSGIAIAAGRTEGTGRITTSRDADGDDETFTVKLGAEMPSGVERGHPDEVEVTIADEGAEGTDVSLAADPNPVDEGGSVTVTATLDQALPRAVTIPVAVERGTSESGDHGGPSSIRIAAGDTEGTGTITTRVDDDGDDETFTVSLRSNLPRGVNAGDPASVEVAIVDEGAAEVSLHAEPNPVAEGERVTVTATLAKALARTVTIPLTVERVTSEPGDHGGLSGIRIASGDTEGTGTIATSVDSDTDDEVFVVKLRANLPAGVAAGHPDSVDVTITDRGGDAPGRVRSLRVTPGDGRLDLAWSAPSSGGAVSGYHAEYRKRGESAWQSVYESGGNHHDTNAAVEGLDNGTLYDVRVRAANNHGQGPWAAGSGTPASGGSSNADLVGLSVRVSATKEGTYRSVSLSPSFRSSTTAYAARAPAGTNWARFRPRAASSTALILVHGHEVGSGAESPPVPASHARATYIAVVPADNGTAKEYSVTFQVPSASMSAPGTVTSAVDAALAAVGTLSPEDAAGALLGEVGIERTRLEALDRLGNANGRYDVGDLLAWIERCGNGAARCGAPPGTPPPASDAALPGTAAAAARRPRRRPATGRGRPGRRRTGVLAALLAAALWSCDGAGVVDLPTGAVAPEPGTLAVEWTAPAGGPAAAGALVEIRGPSVEEVRAPGLALYGSGEGAGPWRFVVAGAIGGGPVIEFRVPDRNLAGLYSVRVVEVAGDDHRLLEPDGYRTAVRKD